MVPDILVGQDGKTGQNVERNGGCCWDKGNGNRSESSNDSYHEALYPCRVNASQLLISKNVGQRIVHLPLPAGA